MADTEKPHPSGQHSLPSQTVQNGSDMLNDFCLLQIFNKLDMIDLCSLVCVNKQFKRVSMMLFYSRFKILCYPEDFKSLSSSNIEKKLQMRRVFSLFGHSIQSLKLRHTHKDFRYYDEFDSLDQLRLNHPLEMDVISKYCAGTLKELHIFEMPIDYVAVKPLFESLERLELYDPKFFGDTNGLLDKCNEMKYLKLSECTDCVLQKFPRLDELRIQDFQLDCEKVINLLQLNPQMTKLHIAQNGYDRRMWKAFGDTNFIKVRKRFRKCRSGGRIRRFVDHIYTPIVVDRFCSESGVIFEAMRKIALEQLTWLTLNEYSIEVESIENIVKLKTLRKLCLGTIYSSFEKFNNKLAELPLLNELKLRFRHQSTPLFSINGLKSFIECTPNLSLLVIDTNHSNCFDQISYDILLKAFGRRPKTVGPNGNKLTITIVGDCNCEAFDSVPVVQWHFSTGREDQLTQLEINIS